MEEGMLCIISRNIQNVSNHITKAMVINPKEVQGKTLYNMGTAYAEMQRFGDAIKCFEQAMPRGLDKDQQKLAKEQIRRCNILQKEQQRKMS